MILCLQDEQLQLVMDVPHGDAHGVWKRLTDWYERKTVASKNQTRNALHKCKMESNGSLEAYIAHMKQLTTQLSDMGEVISDGEFRHVLFNGLPEEYGPSIDTLSVNEKLDFEDACASIRDRYERIKLKYGNNEEANVVNENENKNKNNYHNNNKRYQNGYKNQNNSNRFNNGNFRARNRGGFNNNGNRFNNANGRSQFRPGTCSTCQQPGHMAFYCPQNQNRTEMRLLSIGWALERQM